MRLPAIHLCVVQPLGYVHSLGFLDQARYFRHQFRRMGADVTLAKNRLRHDAVNFVFGAHLGFDPALRGRYTCVFVNLEQLGQGGMTAPAAYLKLLASSAVVDYDADNIPAYAARAEDVMLFSFGYAPYLAPAATAPIESRPIDVLFFGSMNDRRRRWIQAIEATGQVVSVLGQPLYGPERDQLIGQAKAVFNCHFYESARFEQARAFQCLSLETPVISERVASTRPPEQFEDAVYWVTQDSVAEFFSRDFKSPAFGQSVREKLAAFAKHDVIEQYADMLAFAAGYRSLHALQRAQGPWKPRQLHIGSGKDYKLGWFNVDILAAAQPDAVIDLSDQLDWPLRLTSETVGEVEIEPGSLDTIYANNVLEHVPDLTAMMSNCLRLLREGGQMLIEVPYERAPSAWQDPTHVRAMNENSWVYYADWFWYLGWFDSRFRVDEFQYLDARLAPCAKEPAHFMRVKLTKVATTLDERMTARTMQADFGGLPTDLPDDIGVPAHARAGDETADLPHATGLPQPSAATFAGLQLTRAGAMLKQRPWLVLTPSHDDGVTESFAAALAEGLVAQGKAAVVAQIEGNLQAQLGGARLSDLAGILTVGAVPLTVTVHGVPLHRVVTCPVVAYFLDSPVYDIARVPVVRQFLADAHEDARLIPVVAERSYWQWLMQDSRPVLPPQSRYLPFAAFPHATGALDKVALQDRLLVVGTLGRELDSGAVRADIERTLREANAPALDGNEVARIADRLSCAGARGNVVADIADVMQLDAQMAIDPQWLKLLTAADSFMKRSRRLAAVNSLRGVPVDFLGHGWEQFFGEQSGFRFLGSVCHADIGRLIPLYRGLVNFDPNWEWGMHDRAYTALAAGVPLLTHHNQALSELFLAEGAAIAFKPNDPDLAEPAQRLLRGRPPQRTWPDAERISWRSRIKDLLAAVTAIPPEALAEEAVS